MRLKTGRKSSCRKRCKPFLVLPVLGYDNLREGEEDFSIMSKNPGLKLFTKTWPPKRANKNIDDRPLTATLEKPTVLDIRLIGKIDMSMVRKEFLNFSNICRLPLVLNKKTVCRPLSLPGSKVKTPKKERNENTDTSSWEDEESSVLMSAKTNESIIPKKKPVNNVINCKKSRVKSTSDANNNNKTFKVLRKCTLKGANLMTSMELNNESEASIKLPEPCRTCGRPDQPERFHSHPTTPLRPSAGRRMAEPSKLPVKSSVQKPIAIKYKSKMNNNTISKALSPTKTKSATSPLSPTKNKSASLPLSRTKLKSATSPLSPTKIKSGTSVQTQMPVSTKADTVKSDTNVKIIKPTTNLKVSQQRVSSAKRTLTCYICGREFGTASLSLHEPKCLEKWERENSRLPIHLQRKPPIKPEGSVTQEEWNQQAWESSQSILAPCKNCGRTFYPDRLLVHQRSCKTPQVNIKVNVNEIPSPTPMSQNTRSATPSTNNNNNNSTTAHQPPSVECYVCGRLFGTHSIKIHERHCLKKWQAENDALPPDMRSPTPTRNGKMSQTPDSELHKNSQESLGKDKEPRTSSASRRPPLFPCYLCGKLFSVNSIYIHEPQCLKMWKMENDKLPSNKRRPVPLKPDIKFTREINVVYFFVRYKFDWDPIQYSIFSTFQFVVNTLGTVFSLMFFTKFLKLDDSLLGVISCMSKILASLVYAFAPTPSVLYVATIVEMLNGTSFIAMRSMVSKLVPVEELGKINSLFGLAEAVVPLVYGPLYSKLYSNTMEIFPGAFYLAGGSLTTPAVFIFFWLYLEQKKDKKATEELEQQEELLKKNGLPEQTKDRAKSF